MAMIIERRKIFYIISLILIIPGIASLFLNGLNLGIDFRGGSIVHVKMAADVSAPEVREALVPVGLEQSEVQKNIDNTYFIRTSELDQEQTKALINALETRFGEVELMSAESVGATIGRELGLNALMALGIGLVLMLVYISFRFEWTFGVAAVLALMHNVLVVVGVFSIFQWEINSPFIASILTVVGFTLNDTIVVFDRVRENMRSTKKPDYLTLLNKSILQVLNRSINTVLTAVMTLVALLILGGATLKFFVAAMLIGFVVGAYSSICIASPLWYEIKKAA
ncbi:MAG TPA: protein translocase subunit SecF [Syntrophomonas sp.]|nr:protein translocase subunit SecF [Syntrophomonas sp.]